jgi:hypothetical protein
MASDLFMTPRRSPRLQLARVAAAIVALLVLVGLRRDIAALAPSRYSPVVLTAVLAAAALAAAVAIQGGVGLLIRGLERQSSVMVRNLATWTLYLLLGLWIMSAAGLDLSGLLLGGALVGVVVAAASQASLGNFFAGLLLLFSRPYRVGAAVRLRGPALAGGEYEGTVLDMGALYTTLVTASGELLKLPNSAVITSALVLGEAPLQAEIGLDLPPATPLGPIEQALRARLGGDVRSVMIKPERFDAGLEGRLVCRVQVRSTSAVEPSLLAQALAWALATTVDAPLAR